MWNRRSLLFSLLCVAIGTWIVVERQWSSLLEVSSSLSHAILSSEGENEAVQSLLLTPSTETTSETPSASSLPQIAWLLSFPNSGTSYTLALVEEASNRSIGTNYGLEFSNSHFPIPLAVDPKQAPEGPFWEGLESDIRFGSTVRELPDSKAFLLTKTHCGGRCVKCHASRYLETPSAFLHACQRTTFRSYYSTGQPSATTNSTSSKPRVYSHPSPGGSFRRDELPIQEGSLDASRVARAVHLIRNPMHNVVSRFHLEARHWNKKQDTKDGRQPPLPLNATGFATYCQRLNDYSPSLDEEVETIHQELNRPHWMTQRANRSFIATKQQLKEWLSGIPCRADFVKYVYWHNHVVHHVLPVLGAEEDGSAPIFTLYYEDYGHDLTATAEKLLGFLHLPDVVEEQAKRKSPDTNDETEALSYRSFRISNYEDHFSPRERRAIGNLLRALATTETWRMIRHYVRQEQK